MPTLADILQMSKEKNVVATASSSNGKVVFPVSTITTTAKTVMSSTTATCSETTPNVSSMAGKISLVPTNFLMQPSKNITARVVASSASVTNPQIHLLPSTPQLQPRILFSGGTNTPATGKPRSAGIVATGPGGMKVLLLSAEQAAAATAASGNMSSGNLPKGLSTFMPLSSTNVLQLQSLSQQQVHQAQTATPAVSAPVNVTSITSPAEGAAKSEQKLTVVSKVIPKRKQQTNQQQQPQQQQQQNQQQPHQQQQQQNQRIEIQPLLQQKTNYTAKQKQESQQQQQQQQTPPAQQEAQFTKKDATNLRILLRQLLNAQYESNAINSRRWKLERDRLEFEKSVADRFFTALPNFVDTLKDVLKPEVRKPQQEQETQTPPKPMQPPQATQIFQATPFMTVSSTGSSLRLQPPKLLFTAVRHPTLLTTQNTLSLNSSNLAPITPKVVTVTQTSNGSSETELVVPKEEPQDN